MDRSLVSVFVDDTDGTVRRESPLVPFPIPQIGRNRVTLRVKGPPPVLPKARTRIMY